MKKLFRRLRTFGIFFGMFGVTTAASYFIVSNDIKSKAPKNETTEVEQSFGDKLLAGIMERTSLDIAADLRIQKNSDQIKVNLDGRINNFAEMMNDVSKAELNASATIEMNGVKFNADIDYEYGRIFLAIPEKAYFYMPTDNLLDFISMIPGSTEDVEAPSFFDNINLNKFMKDLSNLKVEDGKAISGGRGLYYTLNLEQKGIDDPEHEPSQFDKITFHLLTDNSASQLIGMRTDTIMIEGAVVSLNVSIQDNANVSNHVEQILPTLENPETIYAHRGDYEQYINFAPAMNIFSSLGKIAIRDQFAANVHFSLKNNTSENKLIAADLRLDGDNVNHNYGLNIVVTDDHDNIHDPFTFAYLDKVVYAKFHNVAVKEPSEQIAHLVDYAMDVAGEKFLPDLLDSVSSSMGEVDLSAITDIASNISNSIGKFTLSGDEAASQLNVKINLEPFGITDIGDIDITIGYDKSSSYGINYFSIDSSAIADFELHLSIDFVDFQEIDVGDKNAYTELTPIVVLAKGALEYFDQEKYGNAYRINFNAHMDDHDESTQDLVVNDSFIQFDIDTMQGNGEIHLVDSDLYHHDIKADMEEATNFLFSYNDTMKGKFNSDTMRELYSLVQDVVNNPDDHFIELFGELIESLQKSPLMQGLNGNYGLLLKYNYFSNLELDVYHLSFDLSLGLFGFDDLSVHVCINTSFDEEASLGTDEFVGCHIDSIEISGLEIMGKEMKASMSVTQYDNSEEAQAARLNPYDEYMDFSDIKVLLELGIRTSKFNYYHMTASLHLEMKVIGIPVDKDFPIDIKVRNNRHVKEDGTIEGNVQVAVEFTSIPRITLVNSEKPDGAYAFDGDRTASIYYQDGSWYIHRVDPVYSRKMVSFIPLKYEYTYYNYEVMKVCSTKYFLDDILNILMGDILGCGDTVMELMTGNGGYQGDGYQIEYEKILQHFAYYEDANRFYFDLNLNTVVGNTSLFDSAILNVYSGTSAEDGVTQIFSKINFQATIALSALLKVNVSLDLDLVDYSVELNSSNELSKMNTFIARNDLPAKLYLAGEQA